MCGIVCTEVVNLVKFKQFMKYHIHWRDEQTYIGQMDRQPQNTMSPPCMVGGHIKIIFTIAYNTIYYLQKNDMLFDQVLNTCWTNSHVNYNTQHLQDVITFMLLKYWKVNYTTTVSDRTTASSTT